MTNQGLVKAAIPRTLGDLVTPDALGGASPEVEAVVDGELTLPECELPTGSLTGAEQIEVFRRIDEEGDSDGGLRQLLIESNLPLIYFHVARYLRGRESLRAMREDLIQAGAVALIRGVDAYDYKRGCQPSTYLSIGIVREMLETVRMQFCNSHISMDARFSDEDRNPRIQLADERARPPWYLAQTAEEANSVRLRLKCLLSQIEGEQRYKERAKQAAIFRWGLDVDGQAPRSLEEVASLMGVSVQRATDLFNFASSQVLKMFGQDTSRPRPTTVSRAK